MKYARIFNQCKLQMSKRPGDSLWSRDGNLGDCMQTLGVENVYKKTGICEPENLLLVNRDDINNYHGEPCTLFMQSWFGDYAGNFPLPWTKEITPVFIGFHLSTINKTREKFIQNKIFESMQSMTAVGCRDRNTMDFLKKLGINAYMSGCMTLTFDTRKNIDSTQQNKIFVVDLDPKVQKHLTDRHLKIAAQGGGEIDNTITHFYYWSQYPVTAKGAYEFEQYARYVLERYRTQAKLVITSKIHVAMPCIALGIPVIFIVDNPFNERFDVLSGIVPIYSYKDIRYIDWNPAPVNIENLKQAILFNVKAMFSGNDDLIYKSIIRLNEEFSKLHCANPVPQWLLFFRRTCHNFSSYLKSSKRALKQFFR